MQTAETAKFAASPLAGATVTAIKSDGTSAGSTTTAQDGTYTLLLPKNDTYVIIITSGSIVMKAVYTVGAADVTVNVNPGTTAAVVILEKKLNTTFDSGTAFSAAIGSVDVNATVTAIAATPEFTATATAVTTAVTANANPLTDTAVISAATTAAAAIAPTYTLMGGAVQKQLTLTGAVSTFAGAAPAQFNAPEGVATDGTNLYVADGRNHTIRKVVISTGAVTTIAGSAGVTGSTDGTGTAARFNDPLGMTTDGVNLYVTEEINHTIRKIVISTGVVTTLAGTAGISGSADGTGAAAQFSIMFGIATDGTNLYVADSGNATIRKVVISSGAVTTLAGTAGVTGSTDGTGTAARFWQPEGIATDGTNLYVADVINHTIRKIVIATGEVTTLAGTAGVMGSANGTGTAALFWAPEGITTDGTNLYVGDNRTIRKIVIATGVVTTLAGTAGVTGSADGTGSAAQFSGMFGIATDGTSLYVAEYDNNTIRKIVIATGVVTRLAGTAGVTGSTDGIGTPLFNYPNDLTTDGVNLYVADTGNSIIRKVVIATGVVTTLAGSEGVTGSTDGTGTAALFNHSNGLTTDGTSLYVADSDNNTIRKVVIATGVVTTLAGSVGVSGSADGTGTAALFYYPSGITTDGTNLYVTDGYTTIRQVVIATGVVTTLAGGAGVLGSTDGTGTAALFNQPYGITTDGTNLYVADTFNGTIRQVVIATGVVTTLAGTAGVTGFTDGTGTAAQFSYPDGITTDGTNLYVADGDTTIRQVVIATGVVTTLAGSAGVSGTTDGTGTAALFNRPRGVTTDGTNLYVADMFNSTIRKIQ